MGTTPSDTNFSEFKSTLKEKNKIYFGGDSEDTIDGPVLTQNRVNKIFRLYRYISLVLTSFFYLLSSPESPMPFKLGVVLLVSAAALLSVHLYEKYQNNVRTIGLLIFLETLGLSVLLVFTGGLNSIFILYALNPLFLASAYLHVLLTWLYLGIFVSAALLEEFFLTGQWNPLVIFLPETSSLILFLILMTLIMQLFLRFSYHLSEQSERLQQQQKELFCAYQKLSDNHHVIQSLSDFQQEIVSYRSVEDIFASLNTVVESIFPFKKTAILYLDQATHPNYLTPRSTFQILSSPPLEENRVEHKDIKDLQEKWQEFSPKNKMISTEGWVAMPIWASRERISAVFMGWTKDGVDKHQLPGSLSLFIYFTEQVMQRLVSFRQAQDTLKHISSLYEAVETVAASKDLKEVMNLFAAYAKALTGSEKTVLWIERDNPQSSDNKQNYVYAVRGRKSSFPEDYWHSALLRVWSKMQNNPEPLIQLVEDPSQKVLGQLICVPVTSRSRCFGLLAAMHSQNRHNIDEIIQTLSYLAELSAISIERNLADVFADKLLLIEEQNRIANEIHDGVSQNLFSIVYGVDALSKQADSIPEEHRTRLQEIRDLAAKTAREIRFLIYRLSPRHRGDDTFVKELRTYLESLGSLNRVVIDFKVSGKEELLKPMVRNAFYRIIKEATGNAIRHGKCSKIAAELEMTPFGAKLRISDNGEGFDTSIYHDPYNQSQGLGLVNMRELVLSLNGRLNIESEMGIGTTVVCTVPMNRSSEEKIS